MVLAFVSNPDNSIPISGDEARDAEMPPDEDENLSSRGESNLILVKWAECET